jgi:F0F1-type ATP synthase delta subunit
MKYSVQQYAKALVAALRNPHAEQGAISRNFLALARRNGDEALLKKIVGEAGRLARAGEESKTGGRTGVREVVIESARPLNASQKKVIHAFVKFHDIVHEKIDPALVAGVKIIVNDELQFDGTLHAKLNTLFS